MIQNRILHIFVLTVAMTIGAAIGTHAKSIETSYGIDHFEGTQWRVAEFGNGLTARGFTFSFEDGHIYVPLLCEPFVASRKPDGTIRIDPVETDVMCFAISQREMMIKLFFNQLETLVPQDETTLRLGAANGQYIMATRVKGPTFAPTDAGLAQYEMSAVPIPDAPLSVVLQGGPFNEQNLQACKYDHFTRGRMSYWFNISWGDGTISNLQSGPDGESCADIGRHTYDKAGTYEISVYIGTLGNADQPVPLFSGATRITLTE